MYHIFKGVHAGMQENVAASGSVSCDFVVGNVGKGACLHRHSSCSICLPRLSWLSVIPRKVITSKRGKNQTCSIKPTSNAKTNQSLRR